jgi:hypothetical protein
VEDFKGFRWEHWIEIGLRVISGLDTTSLCQEPKQSTHKRKNSGKQEDGKKILLCQKAKQ